MCLPCASHCLSPRSQWGSLKSVDISLLRKKKKKRCLSLPLCIHLIKSRLQTPNTASHHHHNMNFKTLLLLHFFCTCTCVCSYVSVCLYGCVLVCEYAHVPMCSHVFMWGGLQDNFQKSVLFFHMQVLGIELRWLGLTAGALIHRAVLPTLNRFFFP